MSKIYGLINSTKKEEKTTLKTNFSKPSVFGSESDSEDSTVNWKGVISPGANERRQARKIQEKALEEDPTVFQYDELYDEFENKRDQEKNEKYRKEKKPKYISRLLQCAERRKIENERRLERMIQKERELEGEQFKDKESFVTSSYRKKLEELRKAEEREKREEYLEAIGDVRKQQNLDGFYRHLYEQKLGSKNEMVNKNRNDEQENCKYLESSSKFKSTKSRMYRKRSSTIEEEVEKVSLELVSKRAHLQSNLDADSDFSIDSSEDEDESQITIQSSMYEDSKCKLIIKTEPEAESNTQIEKEQKFNVHNSEIQTHNIKKEQNDKSEKEIEDKFVKIDKKNIWKKRTVGEIFEAALKRYYERKAIRNA